MTPFGEKLRALRRQKDVTQKQMAAAIGVSPAYLSALEHGHRGVPSWTMLQRIIGYFNVIWDEADELANLARESDPRPVIDTAGLSPRANALANRLAQVINRLDDGEITELSAVLENILSARGESD